MKLYIFFRSLPRNPSVFFVTVLTFQQFAMLTKRFGGDYFRRLAPDCAPLELHLSDCAWAFGCTCSRPIRSGGVRPRGLFGGIHRRLRWID